MRIILIGSREVVMGGIGNAKVCIIIFIAGVLAGVVGTGFVLGKFFNSSGGAGHVDADRIAEQFEDLEQEHKRTVAGLEATIEQQRREVESLRGSIAEARGFISYAGRVCESIAGTNTSEGEIIDAAIAIASQVYTAVKSADRVLGSGYSGNDGSGDLSGL
jgi:hypothetical protein